MKDVLYKDQESQSLSPENLDNLGKPTDLSKLGLILVGSVSRESCNFFLSKTAVSSSDEYTRVNARESFLLKQRSTQARFYLLHAVVAMNGPVHHGKMEGANKTDLSKGTPRCSNLADHGMVCDTRNSDDATLPSLTFISVRKERGFRSLYQLLST